MREIVSEIDQALRAAGTPARAAQEKRYLKSELEHLGAGVPAVRAIAKRLRRERPGLERAVLLDVASALWAEPVHERRLCAIELLTLYVDRLEANDAALLERLLREARTWALVDPIATNVVGALVTHHPKLGRTLDRWAQDENFWIRRAALLALLVPLRSGGGDFERFGRYADAMLEEKEFFIRKAIGWVLRETTKKTPERVVGWLGPRAARASGITMREAVKHLPERDRRALLAAGARRGA
ncbi:DNA alkylation repair protein [Polyangium sp. 15x6]|uniref:DNA alkylation repair protein n=1 Tax=Polyangium sp. 15x6 TaxID=3042687 RepID=UPI00249B4AEA|nr:DNA alkylation repair protein [Polyangium sp. 15x6]MDI3288980.1 DNA alkylation repair protein [Polyangium sp. 15x6]